MIFLGQRQIAWKALEALARPENRAAIALAVLVTDSDTFARVERELPSLAPRFVPNDKRRKEEIIAAIREEGVDLLISVQHNWILSKEILDAVDGCAFNLHNARLPHYQGYNSVSHAILNGDKDYYSTIHWMEEEVDTGAIAFEEVTPISPTDTALSLHRKTITAAAIAFEKLLKSLKAGEEIPRRTAGGAPSRFYGKNSLKEILDVTAVRDPEQLDRLARALFYVPHNIAYQVVEGRRTYLVPQSGVAFLRDIGFALE